MSLLHLRLGCEVRDAGMLNLRQLSCDLPAGKVHARCSFAHVPSPSDLSYQLDHADPSFPHEHWLNWSK